MTRSRLIGVGLVGAGLVTQSIHVPTLASLHDRFRIRAIWDVDVDLAEAVAATCAARSVPDLAALMTDPTVEVVAVCSPAAFHADHVIAAMEAGKRAVLVEKPLAMTRDEAARIAEIAARTGTPLIVGAMHVFDPAWGASAALVDELRGTAGLIRSRIVLPYNPRFEPCAFEALPRAPQAAPTPSPDRRLAILRGGILQLAIHDLPLVRALLRADTPVRVTAAETGRRCPPAHRPAPGQPHRPVLCPLVAAVLDNHDQSRCTPAVTAPGP